MKAMIKAIKLMAERENCRVVWVEDELVVYQKPGFSSRRFKTDPGLAGSRASIDTLKQYSKGEKLLRRALGQLLEDVKGAALKKRLLLLMKTLYENQGPALAAARGGGKGPATLLCFDLNEPMRLQDIFVVEHRVPHDALGNHTLRLRPDLKLPAWVSLVDLTSTIITINFREENYYSKSEQKIRLAIKDYKREINFKPVKIKKPGVFQLFTLRVRLLGKGRAQVKGTVRVGVFFEQYVTN